MKTNKIINTKKLNKLKLNKRKYNHSKHNKIQYGGADDDYDTLDTTENLKKILPKILDKDLINLLNKILTQINETTNTSEKIFDFLQNIVIHYIQKITELQWSSTKLQRSPTNLQRSPTALQESTTDLQESPTDFQKCKTDLQKSTTDFYEKLNIEDCLKRAFASTSSRPTDRSMSLDTPVLVKFVEDINLIIINNNNFESLKNSLNMTYDLIIYKLKKIIRYQSAPAMYYCNMRMLISYLFKCIRDCIKVFVALLILLSIKPNFNIDNLLKKPTLFDGFFNTNAAYLDFKKGNKISFFLCIITLYLKLNELLSSELSFFELSYYNKEKEVIQKNICNEAKKINDSTNSQINKSIKINMLIDKHISNSINSVFSECSEKKKSTYKTNYKEYNDINFLRDDLELLLNVLYAYDESEYINIATCAKFNYTFAHLKCLN